MLGYARILEKSRGDLYENPLRIGEVVKLRSGGPAMTVVMMDGERVGTQWLDDMGVLHSGEFGVELVERTKVRRSFFGRWR